ncbi:MAG: ATP-binding protein, partial [Acidobacteriota bacterium]
EDILSLLRTVGEVLAGLLARGRAEAEKAKLAEQLRQAQKMEAIGQLAGGIAHDFNNLLTVIGGHAELARLRLGPNEAVSEHLKEIEVAQDRASSLTRQLLAFGRKQNLEERVVNPNTIIEQLQKMLRRVIGEDIELRTDCDPDLYNIRVDPGQLEQVITNLAVNARDAMPSGGVLSVSTRNVVLGDELPDTSDAIVPGEYVRISVQDTGTGIDEQNIPRIFEPFFTTKAQGKGTGLGLSTVYGIIRQSRGYVCCQSNPSNGTTFEIYLPRSDEGLSVETPEGQAAPAITSIGRGRTILVVEDESAVRSLVSRILRSAGFIVLEAANGWEALREIRLYRPRIDLVLTDIVMPGMRGPSLVARIHEEAGYEQVRTLFMSGYAGPVLDHASERNEGSPVLRKPFRRQDVLDKVVSLLDE